VLDKLPPLADPRVLVSSNTVDDAGVYLLDDGSALVLTVDFFTPIVDDPADFGRIAAANAVSDIYAMGGRPFVALNIMCFPDGELPMSVMADILIGSQEKMSEAGVIVIGGHSVSDRELKFGCAVIGTIDPANVVSNAGARPGQILVLTKPLGTGVLATALKLERLKASKLREITDIMSALNRAASEAMVAAGARAATDVTGFGLAGHAIEMAEASGVTLSLELSKIPLLDGALDTLEAGISPGGLFTNQQFYGTLTNDRSGAAGRSVDLVYDPQTSGGLLIALDEERLATFEREFGARGGRGARVMGRVAPKGDRPLELV